VRERKRRVQDDAGLMGNMAIRKAFLMNIGTCESGIKELNPIETEMLGKITRCTV